MRIKIKRIILAVFLLTLGMVLSGCVHVVKPPEEITYEEIPAYSWETLMMQRSFKFTYRVSRESIEFAVEGSGTVVLPDAIRFQGRRVFADEVEELNLAAAGDFQLEKKDGTWTPHTRGEESRIVEEVDRVIRRALMRKQGRGFELTADEDRYLTYSFSPNLAYLDPAFEKKFTGVLQVDGRNLLAQSITAQSEDGDIQFEFTISAVNRVAKIDLPFDENFKITYSIEENGLRTRSVINKRFDEMGRETRIRTSGGMLEVILALPIENQIARTLGEQGKLVILGMNLEGDGARIHTRGQASDVFYFRDTVAIPTVTSLDLVFDSLSRPVIELKLSEAEPNSRRYDYLGVSVDGVLYQVLLKDDPTDRVSISNVTTYQDAQALLTKLKHPFEAVLVFRESERLR